MKKQQVKLCIFISALSSSFGFNTNFYFSLVHCGIGFSLFVFSVATTHFLSFWMLIRLWYVVFNQSECSIFAWKKVKFSVLSLTTTKIVFCIKFGFFFFSCNFFSSYILLVQWSATNQVKLQYKSGKIHVQFVDMFIKIKTIWNNDQVQIII